MTDVFSETNTAVPDTDAKPAVEYVPMADSFAQEEPKKKYASDSDGLKEAAADLEEARTANAPQPQTGEDGILTRNYQFLTGERAGEAIPENQTITAERAARDVAMMREYEAALQQPQTADIAAAIDGVRNQYSTNPQPQQPEAQAQTTEQPQQAQQPAQPPLPDGVDPEIAAALQASPKLRSAIEAELATVEQSRAQYAQSARAAAQITAAALLSNFPEIASLSAQEMPYALQAIAKTDPAKAQAIENQLGRVKSLYAASQEAERAQQQIQAARFQEYGRAEDKLFEAAIANESPETKRAVQIEGARILQQHYGVDVRALSQAVQTSPELRNSSTQRMLFDLIKTKLAQENIPTKLDRTPPPAVQRPGVARDYSVDDGAINSAMARFRSDPSVANASKLLLAKRAATRK